MLHKLQCEKGVTLIELLVAVSITAIMALVISQIFITQNKLYVGEQTVSYNISNVRIVVDFIARRARMIGYDPEEGGNSIFGLKDSTGNFTTNPMTSNTALYFTQDDDEDGLLDANALEMVALSYNAANKTIQIGGIGGAGGVNGWADKWHNVTAFSVAYIYNDGSSSNGILNLPDNTITNKNYDDVTAMVITVTTEMEQKHNLTGQIQTETVETTILLRNAIPE